MAKIEGSDPDAPTLMLMGHTDVVPVNPEGWSRDPFAAEVVDGFVWGRGAVDMLNLTASQAVAFRRLADSGFRPKGTLIYFAVADEEALGTWGADWLLDHERDAVYADYVLTESGGFQIPSPAGPRLPVLVGEKGTFWTKIRVHGTPGPRLAAVPHRQRAGHRGRGRAPYRGVPPADPDPRVVAPLRRGHALRSRDHPHALLDPDQFEGALGRTAARDARGTGTRARTRRSRRRSRTAAPRPT